MEREIANSGSFCYVYGACVGVIGYVLLILTVIGFGLAKIIMGAVHWEHCTLEPKVCVYLIIAGIAPVVFSCAARRNSNREFQSSTTICCGIIGLLVNFAWTICGSVWIYPTFATVKADDFVPCEEKVHTGCSEKSCNISLITFAVAVVSIDWICTAIAFYIVCKPILCRSKSK